MTIAREWKARCPSDKADGFIAYLYETGVADTRTAQGFEGAHIYRRDQASAVEIVLVTFWESRDAAQAYSGPDLERAVLYPEDSAYDLDPDHHVTIYEVVDRLQRP